MTNKIDLSPKNLVEAYRHGIFPMGDENGDINWYEADPRGILPFENFHIPHDLKRILRQQRFHVTLDNAFERTILACAERHEPTWITQDIIDAYLNLHTSGYAHSVEAWAEGELVGGLYGVTVGGAFFGESMFFRKRDASKVALVYLTLWLRHSQFLLFDIQMVTDVLRRFGATHITKKEYLQKLSIAIANPRKLTTSPIDWDTVFNTIR